ncbi:MAG: uroporphyrinogen-III synthase [Chakrabartia sp.]
MRPLLILRPEPGASATEARARTMGLNPISVPLFKTTPIAWTAPDLRTIDAVLVTSAAAMRHGGSALKELHTKPLFAVGEASASAARAVGFSDISVGIADGAALLLLAAQAGHQRIVHLAGQDHRSLSHANITLETKIVYAATPLEPPPVLQKYLAEPCIVMVHSPRAAAYLATLCSSREQVTLIAISAPAAKSAGSGWAGCYIAHTPHDNVMLALAAQVCENEKS